MLPQATPPRYRRANQMPAGAKLDVAKRASRILEGSLVAEYQPGKQKVDWRRPHTTSPYVSQNAAAMPPLAPTSTIFCLSLAPLSHHAAPQAQPHSPTS